VPITEAVRSRLALVPVLAVLPFLSGCFGWGYGAGSSESESGTATLEAPAETGGGAAVREAIPYVEAYYADNQTYAGVTGAKLEQRYGFPLAGVVRVTWAEQLAYCVEAPAQAPDVHYEGPRGPVSLGPCPRRPRGAGGVQLPRPAKNLHAAVRAMDGYRNLHGTYEGVTMSELREFVRDLRPVRIVEAGRDFFCLESEGGGHTYAARESGDVGVGGC
jgi:hypothetical protein